MSDLLLAEAHRFLDWARDQGAELDGTDDNVWFVQGILESMAQDLDEPPGLRGVKVLAYSVYLAETLAGSCRDVRCVVEGEGMELHDVRAEQEGEVTQFVLNWVLQCLEDPKADNVGFKFAGALKDFGEQERAAAMYRTHEEYLEFGEL